ncbi:hypothetical protein L1987_19798 [Smallanthus sonchifolius]|uniref:Uncharacterized protein n=1 Tax=Smallanthus sonchifolius TaxID=185202 RepID=A0ACB9IPM4_9ASTR|nr:hypothetical protein L1987_19798 [Smallanthus sonchifolius]
MGFLGCIFSPEPNISWTLFAWEVCCTMIDYNVPGGKMIRGLAVVQSYQLFKREKLTDDEVFLACALGWCIEWLQAYLIVHDDIIDGSHTRRGHSCWFRLPEVGMAAVNDAVILANHVPRILKKHFSGKAYYVNLQDLFNEDDYLDTFGDPDVGGQIGSDIENSTCSWLVSKALELANDEQKKILCENYGIKDPASVAKVKELYHVLNLQMIDYNVPGGKMIRGLAVVESYQLLTREKLTDDHEVFLACALGWCIEWDDYLDTFGDPDVVGLTGSDIENSTCSWLVAKALELVNDEQKKILCVSKNHNSNLFHFQHFCMHILIFITYWKTMG